MHQPAAQDHAALGKLSTTQHHFILQTYEAASACCASRHRARLSCESQRCQRCPGPTRLPPWPPVAAVPEMHVPTGTTRHVPT